MAERSSPPNNAEGSATTKPPALFYIRRGESVIGPLSQQQLAHVIVTDQVSTECGVSRNSNGPWRAISAVPQLVALVPSPVVSPTSITQEPLPPTATNSSTTTISGATFQSADFKPVAAPPKSLASVTPPPLPNRTSPLEDPLTPIVATLIDSQRTPTFPLIETDPVAGGGLRQTIAQNTKRLVQTGREVTGRIYEQGREHVTNAYREAISAVDTSESIKIEGSVVFGRKDSEVDVLLSHPQVSQKHAVVERDVEDVWIRDLGSDGGTFVAGERIQQRTLLPENSQVGIGPYLYQRVGDRLVSLTRVNSTELVCRELKQVVTDRSTGDELTILNEVSLVANPREFLVLLGPSGSGKSTLLNALAARTLPTSGDVAINGQNLYANFDSLKQSIAVIPQKDVLHDQLKLHRALAYTAHLRLPPDSSHGEVQAIMDDLLTTVELSDRTDTPIHALSGGQIKRASVANELLSNPGLIFVDEATSGLDEYTDGELMSLFRRLAEDGKTIVCITHNLTNVEKFSHRVAILAPGGYLAFVGKPADALEYFNIRALGDVYLRLKDQSGEQWKQQFCTTDAYLELAAHTESIIGRTRPTLAERGRPSPLQHIGIFVRQTHLLVQRGAEIQLADRNNLLMVIGQCMMVALLISLLFGDATLSNQEHFGDSYRETQAILFLMTISSFWFGCNNAAKEIVKERSIYEREQAVNLNVGSYYVSKFMLLASVTTLQIAFLFIAVRLATGLEGNELLYSLSLWITGMTGVSLGLAVSSYASSENVAVTAVPLVVIPQVILAGMIGQVTGLAKFIAAIFVTCFWSFGSVAATIPESLGFVPAESIQNEHYWFSLAAVSIHLGLFAALAIGRLVAVGRRWTLTRTDFERWMRTTGAIVTNQAGKLTTPVQ